MGNMLKGVSLDDSADMPSEEVEPDGVDLTNIASKDDSEADAQIVTQLEPERMSHITSDWNIF